MDAHYVGSTVELVKPAARHLGMALRMHRPDDHFHPDSRCNPREGASDRAVAEHAANLAAQIRHPAALPAAAQRPSRVARSSWTTPRATANSSAMVCSAIETAATPGVFVTVTPARAAAGR